MGNEDELGWHQILQQRVPFLRDPLTETAPAVSEEEVGWSTREGRAPGLPNAKQEVTPSGRSLRDKLSELPEFQSRPANTDLAAGVLLEPLLPKCHCEVEPKLAHTPPSKTNQFLPVYGKAKTEAQHKISSLRPTTKFYCLGLS